MRAIVAEDRLMDLVAHQDVVPDSWLRQGEATIVEGVGRSGRTRSLDSASSSLNAAVASIIVTTMALSPQFPIRTPLSGGTTTASTSVALLTITGTTSSAVSSHLVDIFQGTQDRLELLSQDNLSRITLEEFETQHLTTRDELAYRALRGEPLLPREAIELEVLNSTLERLLPKSTPLAQDVNDAIAEVHRLLGM